MFGIRRVEAAKKKKDVPSAPKPVSDPKRREEALKRREEILGKVLEYIRRLNTGVKEENEAGIFRMFVERPVLPRKEDPTAAFLYPSFPKGFPMMQMYFGTIPGSTDAEYVEPKPVNVLRIGLNQVQTTQMASLARLGRKKPAEALPHGVNVATFSPRPALHGDLLKTPISPVMPDIAEDQIKDGTYAVAVGKTSAMPPSPDDMPLNSYGDGGYGLSGFLIRLKDNPAVGNVIIRGIEKSLPANEADAKAVKEFLTGLFEQSFVMIGDRTEGRDTLFRSSEETDGVGQTVWVSLEGGFKRMGMVHASFLITADGASVKFDANGLAEKGPDGKAKEYVSIHLVHGSEAIKKSLGQ